MSYSTPANPEGDEVAHKVLEKHCATQMILHRRRRWFDTPHGPRRTAVAYGPTGSPSHTRQAHSDDPQPTGLRRSASAPDRSANGGSRDRVPTSSNTPRAGPPKRHCFTPRGRCMGGTKREVGRCAECDTDKMNLSEQYTRDENPAIFNHFRLLLCNSFTITLLLLNLTPIITVCYA